MYSIYHIEGVKIGVSKNVKRRVKTQGYDNYEILEEHTDVYEVSIREQRLQREYGYPVDKVPYWKTINISTKESRIKGGKKGIKKMTKETRSKAGKKGGKASSVWHINSGHLKSITKIAQQLNKIPIIQMDLDGNFIKEWDSTADCARGIKGHASNINKVLRGLQPYHKGYTFKYKE